MQKIYNIHTKSGNTAYLNAAMTFETFSSKLMQLVFSYSSEGYTLLRRTIIQQMQLYSSPSCTVYPHLTVCYLAPHMWFSSGLDFATKEWISVYRFNMFFYKCTNHHFGRFHNICIIVISITSITSTWPSILSNIEMSNSRSKNKIFKPWVVQHIHWMKMNGPQMCLHPYQDQWWIACPTTCSWQRCLSSYLASVTLTMMSSSNSAK